MMEATQNRKCDDFASVARRSLLRIRNALVDTLMRP